MAYLKEILEMNRVCKIAFEKDLIDTHSGNISMGIENNVLITKTGKSLIDLKPHNFTIVPLYGRNGMESDASSELEIHKFILKSFPGRAVLHSHPLNAITLSLCLSEINDNAGNAGNAEEKSNKFKTSPSAIKKLYKKYPDLNKIIPIDFESAYFFPEIYVFPLKFIEDIKTKTHNSLKTFCEAKDIFKENGVFMIKSHGSFSWGTTPLEALRWTMTLEASSKIILKRLSVVNVLPPA